MMSEIHPTKIECRICYTFPEKQTFMDCGECTKKICTDCFSKLRRLKCPHCRHKYHTKDIFYNDSDDLFIPLNISFPNVSSELSTDLPSDPPVLERQNAMSSFTFELEGELIGGDVHNPLNEEPTYADISATPIPLHAIINSDGNLELNLPQDMMMPNIIELSDDEVSVNYEADETEEGITEDGEVTGNGWDDVIGNDDTYTLDDRYFSNPLFHTRDILREFRNQVDEERRISIRSVTYDAVKSYFYDEIALEDLMDVLNDAKYLHNNPPTRLSNQ